MKNPLKNPHPFCWILRVYGMQNDRFDLAVILAEKNCKIMVCRKRYLQNKWRKIVKEVHISLAIVHYFATFSSKNDREIELVVSHTINPVNSTKWVTTFSWIFHFSLKDFLKKMYEIFSHKCQMPLGYVELCARFKKNLFWGDSQLPLQNASTKVRLLYLR